MTTFIIGLIVHATLIGFAHFVTLSGPTDPYANQRTNEAQAPEAQAR